jgi:hypothetical protein
VRDGRIGFLWCKTEFLSENAFGENGDEILKNIRDMIRNIKKNYEKPKKDYDKEMRILTIAQANNQKLKLFQYKLLNL